MNETNQEKTAFCEEILKNEASLYRLAYSLTGNDEDAADVLQETILSAYKNLHQLRNFEKFRPWVFRILTNTAYEYLRRKCPVADLENLEEVLPAPDSDPCETLSLRDAIDCLDPMNRSIITLFYYEELDTRSISRIVGMSEVNVRARLSRSRARLKEILTEDGT